MLFGDSLVLFSWISFSQGVVCAWNAEILPGKLDSKLMRGCACVKKQLTFFWEKCWFVSSCPRYWHSNINIFFTGNRKISIRDWIFFCFCWRTKLIKCIPAFEDVTYVHSSGRVALASSAFQIKFKLYWGCQQSEPKLDLPERGTDKNYRGSEGYIVLICGILLFWGESGC